MKSILAEERPSLKTKAKLRVIPPDEFLTTRELMRILKIKHKQTIYTLINEGLPTIVVGKGYRFIKDEVISFFKHNGKHKTVGKRPLKK